MLKCSKCHKRMFIDRRFSEPGHLETYCLACGFRKFFHPPAESEEGRWLLAKELYRAKFTITKL